MTHAEIMKGIEAMQSEQGTIEMKTTKETCIKCGHVANVQADCKLWACAECGRMQRTAALSSQRHEESIASRRDNLVALVNTYNESSSPSVPRTDAEHAIERDRAKIALGSIRRNYIEGTDYKEFSNGALWPIQSSGGR